MFQELGADGDVDTVVPGSYVLLWSVDVDGGTDTLDAEVPAAVAQAFAGRGGDAKALQVGGGGDDASASSAAAPARVFATVEDELLALQGRDSKPKRASPGGKANPKPSKAARVGEKGEETG
jgi:hypothetical protein